MAINGLTLSLTLLAQHRASLVEDFLQEHPEIYTPSFKYETSPVLLKLAREKYFTLWLGQHWHLFSQALDEIPIDEQRDVEIYLSQVLVALLKKYSVIKTEDAYQVGLGKKLIDKMTEALNELIKSGNKADIQRNQLEGMLEKNRALFDREFKRLSEA